MFIQPRPPSVALEQKALAALDPTAGEHWVVLRVGGLHKESH